jgi:DNA-binding MarR family transcriptional regulator
MRFYVTKFGISLPEMRILSSLNAYGPQASRELVAVTAMDKALVSRVVSRLADRGYVNTLATRPGERLRGWALTPSGQAFVARLQPVWEEREARLQAGLAGPERELLLDLLERLFWASENLRAEEVRLFAARRGRHSRNVVRLDPGRRKRKARG